MSGSRTPGAPARRDVLALGLILLLAAGLRFIGLGWGLRHPPFSDERSFVEATAAMLARGDLDHRFYEYPGLFFYLLAPLVALLPPEARGGASGHLVARGLVAAFSLASVALVFVLGRRLGGTRLGLVAALLLAVSPVDVSTAHMVRPDVVLATFVLLALVTCDRLAAERPGCDTAAGLALGLAASVKFTGLLLVPSYLLRRALVPGRRAAGVLRAGLAALLVGAAATPYAWLRPGDFVRGARYQMAAHYRGQSAAPGWADNLGFYVRTAADSLGWGGGVLVLAGLVLALRRDGRRWVPGLVFAGLLIGVMATAELRFARFLVPITGVLALLAARAVDALAARTRAVAALVTLAAVLPALGDAARYVRKSARPGPRDAALDWIDAHVPPGARVLDLCRDLSLGLDARRYEVHEVRPKARHVARLAAEMDLIVAYPDAAARLGGFDTLLRVRADRGEAPFVLLAPRPETRARPRPLEIAELRVSPGAEPAAVLRDGARATTWAAPGALREAWIEARFAPPQAVARVELALGTPPRPCAGELGVTVSRDGVGWEEVDVLSARPAVDAQLGALSEALITATPPVRALRVTCRGSGEAAWEVAELTLSADAGAR